MSKKTTKSKNVSVYVRCRPRNAYEKSMGSPSIVGCTKNEVVVKHGHSNLNKKYTFDHVYGPNSTQVDVYKGVAHATIEQVLQGYNCTVFAYGQTGTGKTYTMEGERSLGSSLPWEKDPQIGLIPRCMSHMFDRLSSQASDFSVRVSMLELYNEELFDLLSTNENTTKLKLFEDSTRKVTGHMSRGIGTVVIQGLEEVQVSSKDEVYTLMDRAMQKRKTAETLLNAHSSRSHVVFTVTVHIKSVSQDDECEEEVFKMGKFNLVDLAGSENIGRSGAANVRAREAGNINQSLLTLGRVITALVDRAPHVPYRESKLTRLLQDSLGGKTQTSIIATVSPAQCNMEETLSTLDYANRAKNILNKPEINQRSSKKALIKEYTAEIEALKKELMNSREKCGVYLDLEKYNEMESRMKSQTQFIKEKEEELGALTEAREKISSLFSYSIKQIDGLHQKIDRKEMVESQNRLLLNNFIQNTNSQFSMFSNFMKQQKGQLSENNAVVTRLLEDCLDKDSKARDNASQGLVELMEKVVQGLDTAVQQRDAQHESWFSDYLTNELVPSIQSFVGNVNQVNQMSENTTSKMLQTWSADRQAFGSELEKMDQALTYLRDSSARSCDKLMETLREKDELLAVQRKELDTILTESFDRRQKLMKELSDELELEMEVLQQRSDIWNTDSETKDKTMVEDVSELTARFKHGTDSLLGGHLKVLKEQNTDTNTVEEFKSQCRSTRAMFEELRESCTNISTQAQKMQREYTAQVAQGAESVSAQHKILLSSDTKPQGPHLINIHDKKCEYDEMLVKEHAERNITLQAFARETSNLFEASEGTCQQSVGLINETNENLTNLKKHVREDCPTGQTPKRAKLNRLKLQPSADVSLSVIESDDENSDPNKNPVLDMSY